jgi:hypothetical protein
VEGWEGGVVVKAGTLVPEVLKLCGLLGEVEGRYAVMETLLTTLPEHVRISAPAILGPQAAMRVRVGLAQVGEELRALVHILEGRS